MSTARQGPSIGDDAGFWTQAQDFLFDAARWKLRMDTQRSSDDGPVPGAAETRAAAGGPGQRDVGQSKLTAGGTAMLMIGGAVLLGGLWLATND